jgi:hypothetical protein
MATSPINELESENQMLKAMLRQKQLKEENKRLRKML